jgi:hypothetical protein
MLHRRGNGPISDIWRRCDRVLRDATPLFTSKLSIACLQGLFQPLLRVHDRHSSTALNLRNRGCCALPRAQLPIHRRSRAAVATSRGAFALHFPS